jgi:hypothetical protein
MYKNVSKITIYLTKVSVEPVSACLYLPHKAGHCGHIGTALNMSHTDGSTFHEQKICKKVMS